MWGCSLRLRARPRSWRTSVTNKKPPRILSPNLSHNLYSKPSSMTSRHCLIRFGPATACCTLMANIQLSTMAVCSRQTALQADIRTSMRFSEHRVKGIVISSLDDLTRLKEEEKLWIAPASTCRIYVSIQLLGRISGHRPDSSEVRRWIESCNVCQNYQAEIWTFQANKFRFGSV